MAEPSAKRATFSACGVIDMRECEYDDEVDSERDSDDDYNEDEVMGEGNDV